MAENHPDLLKRLCRLVERTFGLRWEPLEQGLDAALTSHSRELNVSPADLMEQLTAAGGVDEKELAGLVHRLMLGHTRYRRHERVWGWLEDNLESLDLAPPINALVPGCSTGEEVYDLAMALAERFGLENIFVTGLDLSRQALDRAAEGVYATGEVQRLSADRVDRYFLPRGPGLLQVVQPLKSRVRFQWTNIAAGIPGGPYHVIFLRNLLTYFTNAAVELVLESVAAATVRDSILVLAPQETFMMGVRPWAAPVEAGLPIYRCSQRSQEEQIPDLGSQASGFMSQPQLGDPQSVLQNQQTSLAGSEAPIRDSKSPPSAPHAGTLVLPGPALGRKSEEWRRFEDRLKGLLASPPPTVTFDLSLLEKADYHVEKSLSAAVRLLRASGSEVLFVGEAGFLGPLFSPGLIR